MNGETGKAAPRRARNTASLLLASRVIEFAHAHDLLLDAGVFAAVHEYLGNPGGEGAAEVGALLDAGALDEASLHKIAARLGPPDARSRTETVQQGVADTLEVVGERMRVHAKVLAEDVASISQVESLLGSLASASSDASPTSLIESLVGVAGLQRQRLAAQIAASRELESTLVQERSRLDELRREIEDLRTQTTKDALTGLLNRRGLDAKIAALGHDPYSLLLVDIDHFKAINDRFGHPAGDAVIRSVGAVIRHCLRDDDHLARWGGEEFAALLPGTSAATAEIVASRIQQTVANRLFSDRIGGIQIGRVTLSVGGTVRFDGEEAAAIVQRADDALYVSKRDGRNRVTFSHQKEWRKAG